MSTSTCPDCGGPKSRERSARCRDCASEAHVGFEHRPETIEHFRKMRGDWARHLPRMLALRGDGWSIERIAKALGCSSCTVTMHLREAGAQPGLTRREMRRTL